MAIHYRKDSSSGITAPNPDGTSDVVAHITKHRGMKTALTSVSEDSNSIKHFSGILYRTEADDIIRDAHIFVTHLQLLNDLKGKIQTSTKADKIRASRAFQLAVRAKEALINWQFPLDNIDRKERISWCFKHIQAYSSIFSKGLSHEKSIYL